MGDDFLKLTECATVAGSQAWQWLEDASTGLTHCKIPHSTGEYSFKLPQTREAYRKAENQLWLEIRQATGRVRERTLMNDRARLLDHVSKKLGGHGGIHDFVLRAVKKAPRPKVGRPPSPAVHAQSRAELFLAEVRVSDGKASKGKAYAVVHEKLGATDRTVRRDVTDYERQLKRQQRQTGVLAELFAWGACLNIYAMRKGWKIAGKYEVCEQALTEHFCYGPNEP